ncbi:hypothetical protein [Cellulomonas sp.]|uniref:hypothetical protein n=1 Tax=Cellulomonas sp. TaxID=40001 RepID=UPI003BAB7C3C
MPAALTVEPFRTRGRWVVTTASGAAHLIDSLDPDVAATIIRLTDGPPTGSPVPRAALRRDRAALRVTSVHHVDPVLGRVEGVAVGREMWLVLEPLGVGADVTVRRTTPVTAIDPQPADSDQGAVHGDE